MTNPNSINPADFVRPEIRALSAYSLELEDCLHKLDQNEVPWELPRRVRQAVMDRLVDEAWARYPDFHSDALRQAVASANAHPWQGVLVGNGSNELLQVALSTLAGPGTEVLSADPSFALYRRMILASGARPIFLPPRVDLSLPIDELLARTRPSGIDLTDSNARIEKLRAFGDRPATEAYVARVTGRAAFRKVQAEQIAQFEAADRARVGSPAS